ncbi:hypothetical protein C4568_04860 [Candidatus Parcubacteria bacterium]|nr:MAG: hypothetical protein C4568_04860 [Candidatus Parcubacteria bacterium]
MKGQERLTEYERDSIRAHLKHYMSAHPARAPLYIRALDWSDRAFGQSGTGAFGYTRFAGAALVLVLFAGAGTSYVAQTALPGQALYGVKVNINEKVAGAFATTPVEKAEYAAELTARRLEEAEVLAASNQLTPEVSSEIQARIDETAADFNGSVAVLAESENGIDVAEDVQLDLEATLSAHANVLAALTETVPETKVALEPIISSVETHVATARSARSRPVTVTLSFGAAPAEAVDNEPARAAATKKQEDAQAALGRVRTLASEADASSSVQISQRTLEVEVAAQEGEGYLNTGEYDKAEDSFDRAIRAATQTQVETNIMLELQKILPAFPIEVEATNTVEVDGVSEIGDVLGTTTKEQKGRRNDR